MRVTQEKIAQELGLHPATVSKILNRVSTDYTSVETRQKVFDLALKLGYDFRQLKLKSVRSRSHQRKVVDLPAQVVIVITSKQPEYKPAEEIVWDRGQARIRNISSGGALLADLQLTKDVLPLKPFRLKLMLEQDSLAGQPDSPPGRTIRTGLGLAGMEIPCQVVRLETSDKTALGLKFDAVSQETRNRLSEFWLQQ